MLSPEKLWNLVFLVPGKSLTSAYKMSAETLLQQIFCRLTSAQIIVTLRLLNAKGRSKKNLKRCSRGRLEKFEDKKRRRFGLH